MEQGVASALASLKSIDQKMRAEVGTEAAPSFDLLSTQLTKIDRVLRAQMAVRPGGPARRRRGWPMPAPPGRQREPSASSGRARTRFAALDAVADFFRKNEPSSPVPLFCDRAKRLISKDFLEVLADVAPEALGSARAAGGVRGE